MKNLKLMLFALVATFTLTQCKKDDFKLDIAVPLPATYSRTLQVGSESGQVSYTLTDLKKEVSKLEKTAAWLTVTPMAYTSGSPIVEIAYEENTGGERSAVVTFTDKGGNKVFLTVTQVKKGETPTNPQQPDTPTHEPQTYQQAVQLASWESSEQTITLGNLTEAVSTVECGERWLAAEKLAYTSGSPQLKLTATANDDTAERKAMVTVTAVNGDKVLLAVTQAGRTFGIDDIHNTESDQPAYSRQQQ